MQSARLSPKPARTCCTGIKAGRVKHTQIARECSGLHGLQGRPVSSTTASAFRNTCKAGRRATAANEARRSVIWNMLLSWWDGFLRWAYRALACLLAAVAACYVVPQCALCARPSHSVFLASVTSSTAPQENTTQRWVFYRMQKVSPC